MKGFRLFKNKPKNWLLKLISLTLATMLWYFVVGEDQVDMNIQVPIEILNLPRNLTISNQQYKKEIEVAVRGPRSMIQELRNRNITRPVDLSSAQPGTIVIKNDENSIPHGNVRICASREQHSGDWRYRCHLAHIGLASGKRIGN